MRKSPCLFILLAVGMTVNTYGQINGPSGYTAGSNGNYAINTAPSTFTFDIAGFGQRIKQTNAGSYTTFRLYNTVDRFLEIDYSGSSYGTALLTGGVVGEAASISTFGSYPIMFGTNNICRMTLAASGNVGIGVAAPSNTLSIRGKLGIRNGADPTAATEALRVEGGITAEENVVNVTNLADQDFVIRLSQAGASVKKTFIGPSTATRFSMGVGTGNEQLTIINGGNVGIGTTAPDEKLAVKGKIHAQEVRVDLLGAVAPDYVFEKSYELPSLATVKSYIDKHHHLPEVPSAKEIEENGMNVGEMNLLLLKKIEELTLYVIDLKQQNDTQQKEINQLKSSSKP